MTVDFRSRRQRVWVTILIAIAALATPTIASAQSASAVIRGTIVDESNAALPGVTATLTSPALLVGQLTTVTDANGLYRFGELPAGVYHIKFELAGFKTYVREQLQIPLGFEAQVNATLAVGALEESITVSGQSPVVDVSSTATSVNLTQETLTAVPVSRGMHALFAMTPGVTTTGAPDVGDSNMNNRQSVSAYGSQGAITQLVEGINIVTGNGGSSGVYFTTFSVDEVQIKTSGNDAEVSPAGVAMMVSLKSGSNQFHGTYGASGQHGTLQANNIDDELRAQGVTNTQAVKYYYDVYGDLGGPIVRDKLWFYGALNQQMRVNNPIGFVSGPGPDGRYLTGDEPIADYQNVLTTSTIKGTYQLTKNNKIITAWQPSTKYQPQRDGARFVPLESTLDYKNPTQMYKGELQSTLSPRVFFDTVAGYGGLFADYSAMRTEYAKAGHAVAGNPSRFDRETGLRTGPSSLGYQEQTPTDRWQWDTSVSYFPDRFLGGHHELKAGTSFYWQHMGRGCLESPYGQYFLTYDRVNGVSGQPVEIAINNCPVEPHNYANVFAAYAKDTWRIGNALTLNWGLRWEQQHAFIDEETKGASWQFPTLYPAGSFAAIDVQTWKRLAPRLGFAWNLREGSVLKGTYGIYNAVIGEDYALPYNSLSVVTTTFRWTDPDGNGDYTPGEVNLNTNGPDFLSVSGGSNQLLNPGMPQQLTTQVTTSFEHEVAQHMGLRVQYVFINDAQKYANTNILRPYSAYNIPLQRRDPGPDGVVNTADDGGMVTIYDFDPAYAGSRFVGNQRQASPRSDQFHTVEATLTRRSSGNLSLMASGWMTKRHRWLVLIQDNPNTDPFPLDETWSWAANLTGSYRLPWDMQAAAYIQMKEGLRGQRTVTFRAADPDGGPPLRQQSTVTQNMEAFGAQSYAAQNVVNLRWSKRFKLGGGRRLEADFDVFNVLNSNAPTSATFTSGPTFGYVTNLLPPRIARFGVQFMF